MTKVMLVESHLAFREALARVLDSLGDVTVVGQAGSYDEIRSLLDSNDGVDIDLAVVDLVLPDATGADAIRLLRTMRPRVMVLVLTALTDRVEHGRAVQAGGAAVMLKSASLSELIEAIRRLSAGQYVLSPGELVDLIRIAEQHRQAEEEAHLVLGQLTPREREVLNALAEGLADKEIALRLNVRPETIRTHMGNILEKLGVDSRLAALVFAIRHGAVCIA